jgi:hypothetical protein
VVVAAFTPIQSFPPGDACANRTGRDAQGIKRARGKVAGSRLEHKVYVVTGRTTFGKPHKQKTVKKFYFFLRLAGFGIRGASAIFSLLAFFWMASGVRCILVAMTRVGVLARTRSLRVLTSSFVHSLPDREGVAIIFLLNYLYTLWIFSLKKSNETRIIWSILAAVRNKVFRTVDGGRSLHPHPVFPCRA